MAKRRRRSHTDQLFSENEIEVLALADQRWLGTVLPSTMRTVITVGEGKWDINHPNKLPHLVPLERKLFELFKPWAPKPNTEAHGTYGYPTFEIAGPAGDANLEKAFRELASAARKAKAIAVTWHYPTGTEVQQARFLQPFFLGGYADCEGIWTPLNPQMEACAECRYPKFDFMPNRFLVGSGVLKRFDVLPTGVGLLVVRERALEIFKREAPDAFTYGKATLGGKAAGKSGEALYWVKPKKSLGKRVRVSAGTKTCPECGRTVKKWLGMLDAQVKKRGPGKFDASFRVESYKGVTADIAVVDNSATGQWPTVVMSGRLLAALKQGGMKGISATSRNLPECVFSDEGEPPLRADVNVGLRQTTALAPKASATSFASAQWDCAKDGYVYFELTGPDFVVFDPMTGEQNDGGPFKVKKFAGPGLYRAPVGAIKAARSGKRSIAVDSATLVFVDNGFAADLLDEMDWNAAASAKGLRESYLNGLAAKIGSRFGVCTPPPKRFTAEFEGDGMYTIDARDIVRHSPE